MINLKYPILFVHGMGFRDRKRLCYWGRIPKALEKEGCTVFFGGQDSNGTVESNGTFLAERIKEIISEHKIEKLNVIAHSKGGLDMRYAISKLGMGKYVASLTTISTPHHGSYTVDRLMRFPKPLVKFAALCSDLWQRIGGDKNPDAYSVFNSFTTVWAEQFNASAPDDPDVSYSSYAFVMKNCASDLFMTVTNLAVRISEGENDGLVTPRSAEWTNFKGVYRGASVRGISHCDEVDMRRMRLTRKKGEGVSDIVDFYLDIARDLSERGF